MNKIYLISLLFLVGSANANEQEKEINYLGNNGIEESHQVVCINGKSGIVTINNKTQEMEIKTDSSFSTQNIGRATFGDAGKIICK